MEVKRVRAKVIMLRTTDNSNISIIHYCNELQYSNTITSESALSSNQHLYFTTDEEIKEGDYFLDDDRLSKHSNNGEPNYIVRKCHSIKNGWIFFDTIESEGCNPDWSKKIVASTDKSLGLPQPSEAFVEKYVELGGIDEVDIELKSSDLDYFFGDLKVDSHNTITIHSIKNNWSREEVEKLLELVWATASAYGDKTNSADCKDWIKHNL